MEFLKELDQLIKERKEQLGLDVLKPWDLSVDTFNRDPLTPFKDASELEEKCHNIFEAVDADLGNYLDDYVGCDVNLGLGFCYNGDAEDEGAQGYGFNPPPIGVDFFQGVISQAHSVQGAG